MYLYAPPPAVCRRHMFAVCVLSVCVHSVCMSLGLHVWLCICVLCWASVSCPTGPGCDLSFHLLSLRLLRPTVLRSQPTTQQMSPDTATNTHTQSYVHYVTRTVHVVFHINTQVSVMRTQTVYNPTHGHTPPPRSHTDTDIYRYISSTHTHTCRVSTSPDRFLFCLIQRDVWPHNKHQNTSVTWETSVFPPVWPSYDTPNSQSWFVLTWDVDDTNCRSYHVFSILAMDGNASYLAHKRGLVL